MSSTPPLLMALPLRKELFFAASLNKCIHTYMYLVNHAGVHLLLVEGPAPSLILHVLEVHQLEGVLVGAAAAHHSGHLKGKVVNKINVMLVGRIALLTPTGHPPLSVLLSLNESNIIILFSYSKKLELFGKIDDYISL